ncbi:hypothetical protein ACFOHS_11180 [Jhaorihella thermophila]
MTNERIGRRKALKTLAAGGAASLAAPAIATAAGETITWKIQTSWPGGIGLQIFKDWCASIKEKDRRATGIHSLRRQGRRGRLPAL